MTENATISRAGARLSGLAEGDATPQPAVSEAFPHDLDEKPLLHELQVLHLKLEIQEKELHHAHEELRNTQTILHAVMDQNTALRQTESYRDLGRDILKMLNDPGNLQDSIRHVLALLKTGMEFDAVAIRLQDGDDFPYFVMSGFSKDFLLTENTLVRRVQMARRAETKTALSFLNVAAALLYQAWQEQEIRSSPPGEVIGQTIRFSF